MSDVKIIAGPKTWIEGDAVQQLKKTAELPGMVRAVGMPDLHPGRGTPVGAAFVSKGRFYPHLVGNDIGCGMGLWQTDIEKRKAKRDKMVSRLEGLDLPWDGDTSGWLAGYQIEAEGADRALGTIGGGNHFAELQSVERITDASAFAALGLDEKRLCLLVHSGSRGYGEAVLRAHTARFGGNGVDDTSEAAEDYLKEQQYGLRWAEANRALIARRFLDAVRGDGRRVLDVCHNSVTEAMVDGCRCWLHRKGAAPADRGAIAIPGSRGSFSYLVAPLGDQTSNAWSLAHGAGRKWGRADAKGRLDRRFAPKDLERTELGSYVICEDKSLLYEEAPQAYKNIESVVGDLVNESIVSVIAVFRPIITYKVRRT